MDNNLPLLVLVDDENDVLNSLNRIFRLNFRVMAFSDPKKALQFITDSQIEIPIVISDFKMGDLNGLDFLASVKKTAPTSIRIILSGQIEIQHLSDSINEKIIHKFFMKPWDNEIIKIQIQEALQTRTLMLEKEKFKTLSITDPITHLTNHRFFQEKIKQEVPNSSKSSPCSLIMIDVDHFKSYNDRYGHPQGDQLLLQIAQRLKSNLINIVSFVSRYGGEEFAIILPDCPKSEALAVAETIRQKFEQVAFLGTNDQQIFITISLGVSNSPIDTKSSSDLISLADKALFEAKNSGRNKVCA